MPNDYCGSQCSHCRKEKETVFCIQCHQERFSKELEDCDGALLKLLKEFISKNKLLIVNLKNLQKIAPDKYDLFSKEVEKLWTQRSVS